MRWAPWNAVVEGPEWKCVTRTWEDFTAAAASDTDTVFSLPPGGVIHAVKVKHKAEFTGGDATAVGIELGIASDPNKYAVSFDVNQTPSGTAMAVNTLLGTETEATSTAIIATLTVTDDTCDNLETGIVQFWILWSQPR